MGSKLRDHRTADALRTWTTHRASEPRHARWAERRRKRAAAQATGRATAAQKKGGRS